MQHRTNWHTTWHSYRRTDKVIYRSCLSRLTSASRRSCWRGPGWRETDPTLGCCCWYPTRTQDATIFDANHPPPSLPLPPFPLCRCPLPQPTPSSINSSPPLTSNFLSLLSPTNLLPPTTTLSFLSLPLLLSSLLLEVKECVSVVRERDLKIKGWFQNINT